MKSVAEESKRRRRSKLGIVVLILMIVATFAPWYASHQYTYQTQYWAGHSWPYYPDTKQTTVTDISQNVLLWGFWSHTAVGDELGETDWKVDDILLIFNWVSAFMLNGIPSQLLSVLALMLMAVAMIGYASLKKSDSYRNHLLILGAVLILLAVLAFYLNVSAISGGRFWGKENDESYSEGSGWYKAYSREESWGPSIGFYLSIIAFALALLPPLNSFRKRVKLKREGEHEVEDETGKAVTVQTSAEEVAHEQILHETSFTSRKRTSKKECGNCSLFLSDECPRGYSADDSLWRQQRPCELFELRKE